MSVSINFRLPSEKTFFLNPNLTKMIVLFLPKKDLYTCRTLSTSFRKLAESDFLWKAFNQVQSREQPYSFPKTGGIKEIDRFHWNMRNWNRRDLGEQVAHIFLQSGVMSACHLVYHLPQVLPASIPSPVVVLTQTAGTYMLGRHCLGQGVYRKQLVISSLALGLINKYIGPIHLKGALTTSLGSMLGALTVTVIVKSKFPMSKKAMMVTAAILGGAPALIFNAGYIAIISGMVGNIGVTLTTHYRDANPKEVSVAMASGAVTSGGIGHWSHLLPNIAITTQAVLYQAIGVDSSHIPGNFAAAFYAMKPNGIWSTCVRSKAKIANTTKRIMNLIIQKIEDFTLDHNG